MGTNIEPCVSGSPAMIFWAFVNKIKRGKNFTYSLFPCPITRHEMLITTLFFVIILLIGGIVE